VLAGEVAKSSKPVRGKSRTTKELSIQLDPLHIFLKVRPQDSVPDVVKELKGITAFELRKKHTQLLKPPSMWTRSFFAATVGNVSAGIIQKFIAAQKGS
jgi:putative transposase